jgi:hypothetical protein
MRHEDSQPLFDFNFQKIREHWMQKLGNPAAAAEYLNVVDARLKGWLETLGPWVDFDFAVGHLQKDLDLCQVESHLTWLASRHRLRLANEEKKRLSRDHHWRYEGEMRVEVKASADGRHDAVWHEDFRDIYRKAMERERRKLKKLRETEAMSAAEDNAPPT